MWASKIDKGMCFLKVDKKITNKYWEKRSSIKYYFNWSAKSAWRIIKNKRYIFRIAIRVQRCVNNK